MNRIFLISCLSVLLFLGALPSFGQTQDGDSLKMRQIIRQLQAKQEAVVQANQYPGTMQIQRDLVGHSLAEGVSDGYRPEEWRWVIEEGQIRHFRIREVVEKSKKQYVVIAQMRLSNGYYAYDANIKIKYVCTSQKQWKFDYVVSQGMYIVVTHEYDDFIKSAIVDDGWGGTHCLRLTNISELSLGIGGAILTYNGWQRFSTVVQPNGKAAVGGLAGGGSVQDFRIDFIVRVN